jgi:hypothetical protein
MFEMVTYGRKAVFRRNLAFWSAKVRRDHDFLCPLQNSAYGWESAVDAVRLGDLAIAYRHVEINAQEGNFVFHWQRVDVFNHYSTSITGLHLRRIQYYSNSTH